MDFVTSAKNLLIATITLLTQIIPLQEKFSNFSNGNVTNLFNIEDSTNNLLKINSTYKDYKENFNYFIKENQIYINYSNNSVKKLKLFGVNWFGFETPNYVVHGLWSRNYKEILDQIKELGFNAIRLPFCTYSIEGRTPTGIDYSKNPDLKNLNSLEVMKKIVEEANKRGIYVLLDYHRIGCNYIEPLWYTKDFSEKEFINTWKKIAEEFKNYPNVIGVDLKNEPHSEGVGDSLYTNGATWGYNRKTDWNLAAERIGKEILKIAPHWLIFIEGTQVTNPNIDKSYKYGLNAWWGGNLMAVKDYPINLPKDKLVYSPHVYGPDVYNQPYFNDPNFPNNMPKIWYKHFGYVKLDLKKPVVIGEFGGKFGENDPKDKIWQEAIVDWMIDNDFCDFFYWSWNPNSGDTGGILKEDWVSVNWEKYKNLKRLMDYCSGKISKEEAKLGILNDYKPVNEGQIKEQPQNPQNSNEEKENEDNKNKNSNGKNNEKSTTNKYYISYPEERWPTKFVDVNEDGFNDFVMEINPWNIKNSEGYAKMYVKNNVIYYKQDLRNIELNNPKLRVHSYPEIYVGNKPWNGNYASPQKILPKKLSEFPDLLVNLKYDIKNKDEPMNLAFETWLTKDKFRKNGIKNDEIEVTVWFYYSGLQPAGQKVGEEKIKVYLDGVEKEVTFEVWKGYIRWEYIAFRTKEPKKTGEISFNLKDFLNLLYKYSDFNKNHLDNLYVEDLEIGTEYGAHNEKEVSFSWEFSNFRIKVNNNLEKAKKNNGEKYNNKINKYILKILNDSWLQLYNSKNKKNPLEFQNKNFFIKDNKLFFNICGLNKRVELRNKEEWESSQNINAYFEVYIDPKDSEEFTFLQIVSYNKSKKDYYKPLLRIHWNKNYKNKSNHIWATIRKSLYENEFKKFDLGEYNKKYLKIKILFVNNTLKIIKDNNVLVNEKVNNWNYRSFFKFGVYIQKGNCAEAIFNRINIEINNSKYLKEETNTNKKNTKDVKLELNYSIKWFYKLQNPLLEYEIIKDYKLYNIDLFDNRKEIIKKLKDNKKITICYFSLGSYENWRKDVENIDKKLLGKKLSNWEDERYWNIKNFKIKKILKSRIDLAEEKNCDGVEFDNVDIYKNDNGLNITKEDVIEVFKELSDYAKKKGLLVVLKNSPELVEELQEYYDLILAEECFELNECNYYIKVNKPILDVEYALNKEEFCEKSKKLKVSAAKACYDLNGCWDPCWEENKEDIKNNSNSEVVKKEIKGDLKIFSNWNTGFCVNIYIKNNRKYNLKWIVKIKKYLNGTKFEIKNYWNARLINSSGDFAIFEGKSWNNILRSNEKIKFGFCGNKILNNKSKNEVNYKEITNNITITKEWGSGFCAEVKLINNYSKDVYWITKIDKKRFKINSIWNVDIIKENKNSIIVRGKEWNKILKPNEEKKFGFCAQKI